MPRRAVAIAHHHDNDPGVVGERLEHHGLVLHLAAREDDDPYPPTEGVDLVLALGSAWMVGDAQTRPAVLAEQAYLRAAVSAGIPVLGICHAGAEVVARNDVCVQAFRLPGVSAVQFHPEARRPHRCTPARRPVPPVLPVPLPRRRPQAIPMTAPVVHRLRGVVHRVHGVAHRMSRDIEKP
jgi:GMP synthase-like glutamine amidotransferase